MKTLKTAIARFVRDEEGASAVEYALLATMVAVVIALFVTPISGAINTVFLAIQTALT